jgi:signal transduction histidine kinase
MVALYRWLTHRKLGGTEVRLPVEAVVLRCFGFVYLAVFLVETLTTKPHPSLHGKGLVVLVAMVVFVGSVGAAIAATVRAGWSSSRAEGSPWRLIVPLIALTAVAAVLAGVQPHGIWSAGPYFVAIMAGIGLDRVRGALVMACSLVLLLVVAAIVNIHQVPFAILAGVIPWYLVLRMMRELRHRQEALEVSQVAQARAAAAAERGRLAREMHDVLAHSLSALALQLESTRLLARERGVDADVARAVDQAHHLAAEGLQDARRAIAAARGDELPGPERLGVLAEAFQEQSGLPVAVEVRGEPHELAPDARLAVYRTAQEALTNVRRHATAERVAIELDYRPQSTVLVVEDRACPGTPPPVAPNAATSGYGLTGMRERAELLGGELYAEPTVAGFRVELRLPS